MQEAEQNSRRTPPARRPLDRKAFAIARKALAEAETITREDVAAFLQHKKWEERTSPDGAVRIFSNPSNEHDSHAIIMSSGEIHPNAANREARAAIWIAADFHGYEELEMRLRIAEDRARRRELEAHKAHVQRIADKT